VSAPQPELLRAGPADAATVLLLAHGAGAPMTSPFLETFAALLADRAIATVRFEFAYMAARCTGGRRRPPSRAEALVDEYRAAAAGAAMGLRSGQQLIIGGKSMGGRVASLVADELYERRIASALVVLGYPLHPSGKPDRLRIAHLERLQCPALMIQGERDPFGTRAEIEALRLPATIRWHWAGDGDHDLGPRGGPGITRRGNLVAAADAVAAFAATLTRPSRQPCR
jgi:hypothetical protein